MNDHRSAAVRREARPAAVARVPGAPASCVVPVPGVTGPVLGAMGLVLGLMALTASGPAAQIPFPIPVVQNPQQSQEPDELQPGGLLGSDPRKALGDRLLEGYAPPDPGQTPLFQGFPTLIPPGFSAYPGGELPSPFREEGELPALPPPPALPRSPNAWPTWFRGEGAAVEDGFLPSVGLVAQGSDQIWIRDASGGPFTPLTFYDKFRVVEEGARVQVRADGQFLVAFRGGSSVRFDGRAELELGRLDDEGIELTVQDLADVWIRAGDRPCRMTVRGAALLEAERGRVRIERDGDQLRIANRSSGNLRVLPLEDAPGSSLRSRRDEVEVPPGFALRLFLDGRVFPASAELDLVGDVGTETDGRVLRAEATGGGGAVRWFGANFRLPPGTSLRLDPLSGSAFPDDPAAPPGEGGRR